MKYKNKFLVVVLLILFLGCTANLGNVPWHLDVKNWTPHQKANFFMKSWLAERASYDALNEIQNKSPELIRVLKAKQNVLESSRIPIRMYSNIVSSGGTPDLTMEEDIIKWLRELQTQYLYGG